MRILAFNGPNDGAIAYVDGRKLKICVEGEKDSHERGGGIYSPALGLELLEKVGNVPDVVGLHSEMAGKKGHGGYLAKSSGADASVIHVEDVVLMGQRLKLFHTSRERALILSAFGLSGIPEGSPCYALVWGKRLGRFYKIDANLDIHALPQVLSDPWRAYASAFLLADYGNKSHTRKDRVWDPYGVEIMESSAACQPEDFSALTQGLKAEAERLINFPFEDGAGISNTDQEKLISSPLLGIGTQSEDFRRFASWFRNEIFAKFHGFAKENCAEKLPLIIAGDFGLDCDWNTQWRECGLFPSVSVSPCPNDGGMAIGVAVDALRHFTGKAKLDWSVFCGDEFIEDVESPFEFLESRLDLEELADFLYSGDKVIAWVQGKYEMGPKSLGHRSLLASPMDPRMAAKLNGINSRPPYGGIGAVCTEADVQGHFRWKGPSPHMSYSQGVENDRLGAIIRADGTAKVLTVDPEKEPLMHGLLKAFEKLSGAPVLCNSPLSFNGKGLINRSKDLFRFAIEHELDGVVVGNRFFRNRSRRVRSFSRLQEAVC